MIVQIMDKDGEVCWVDHREDANGIYLGWAKSAAANGSPYTVTFTSEKEVRHELAS